MSHAIVPPTTEISPKIRNCLAVPAIILSPSIFLMMRSSSTMFAIPMRCRGSMLLSNEAVNDGTRIFLRRCLSAGSIQLRSQSVERWSGRFSSFPDGPAGQEGTTAVMEWAFPKQTLAASPTHLSWFQEVAIPFTARATAT